MADLVDDGKDGTQVVFATQVNTDINDNDDIGAPLPGDIDGQIVDQAPGNKLPALDLDWRQRPWRTQRCKHSPVQRAGLQYDFVTIDEVHRHRSIGHRQFVKVFNTLGACGYRLQELRKLAIGHQRRRQLRVAVLDADAILDQKVFVIALTPERQVLTTRIRVEDISPIGIE